MREIKFRGKTPRGVTVYGELTSEGSNRYINDYRVLPESVAQLCGYDSDGDEVYEGDTVIAHGRKYQVELKAKYGLFQDLSKAQLE